MKRSVYLVFLFSVFLAGLAGQATAASTMISTR